MAISATVDRGAGVGWASRLARAGRRWFGANAGKGAALAFTLALAAPAPVPAQGLPPVEGFSGLVERIGPAVVNISTSRNSQSQALSPEDMPEFPPGSPFEDFFRDFFDEERERGDVPVPRRSFSLGSGFVIDPEGYVVTNNHVIAEADEVKVVFNDDTEYEAEVIGRDESTDLALLKIERGEPFPFLTWADSDSVKVGDWMLAIGNPFGLGFSVTAGIISARGRDIRSGPYDDFFQVDAAINRGNSGGPSFTMDGEVFGVNTAIFSPSGGNVGIGFAIPSNLARNVIDSLKDDGRVARGWLGVRIQSVSEEIAESLDLESSNGALVANLTPRGPAEESGIEVGDVILSFNGKTIDSMRSLPRIVAETPIGREVEVEVWRRGERETVMVTLGELPDEEQLAALESEGADQPEGNEAQAVPEIGLSLAPLEQAGELGLDVPEGAQGVLVVEVDEDGPAAEEGFLPGDLIEEVGQEPVGSPEEVTAMIEQARSDDKRSVLLLVNRDGDQRFVVLNLQG